MNDVLTNAGGLEVHLVQPEPSAKPELLVVFCHGYGASGDDLVPFVPELVARAPGLARARFAFPAGPLSMPGGWGDGKAWWPLDWQRLMTMRATEAGRAALRDEAPEGLVPARRKLQACVEALMAGSGLGPERTVLGGFSQGAMLSTDLALTWDARPAALVALSGVVVNGQAWRKLAPRRAGLPAVLSHGTTDPVLPYAEGEALRDLLAGAGLAVEFVPFDGPHTVHPGALDVVARSLGALAGGG